MTIKKISILFTLCIISFFVLTNSYTMKLSASSTYDTYYRHNYRSSNLASKYTYYIDKVQPNEVIQTRSILPGSEIITDVNNMQYIVRFNDVMATGFIIEDHVIATAAHVVYNRSTGMFRQFTISVVDNDGEEITEFSPRYAHINKLYADSNASTVQQEKYDYALIYVDEDLSSYGKMYLGVACDDFITNQQNISITGFPNINNSAASWGTRYTSNGNVFIASNQMTSSSERIFYTASTVDGNSGSPVYISENVSLDGMDVTINTAIAIHTKSGGYQGYPGNLGTRITSDRLKFYYSNPEVSY